MNDNHTANGPEPPDGKPSPPLERPVGTHATDSLVLLPRDPEWLHAYWEFPDDRLESAAAELDTPLDEADRLLRLHNVTKLIEPSTGHPRLDESKDPVEIPIEASADHWYIKADGPEQVYCVEYILTAKEGRSTRIALSNLAATPAEEVASATDETWVTSAVTSGQVTKTAAPSDSKWIEGHDAIHEALTSLGADSSDDDD